MVVILSQFLLKPLFKTVARKKTRKENPLDLGKIGDRIKKQFEASFKGSGQTFDYQANIIINVSGKKKTDHVITIVEDIDKQGNRIRVNTGKTTGIMGLADGGQNWVLIDDDTLKHQPEGPLANGVPSVERTGAHEVGRSIELPHPFDVNVVGPFNLMNETFRPDAGYLIQEGQILLIERLIPGLNSGKQKP